MNTIQLNWTTSVDSAPGIGLSRYDIYRDGRPIASVAAGVTMFVDSFSANSPDLEFTYEIQPIDSLGHVQRTGGEQACSFRAVPMITMLPEPEFTAGDSNQVCWTGARDVAIYSLFLARAAAPNDTVRVDLPDTCHTFTNLDDGSLYSFWVIAVDSQQRTIMSDIVKTTQDATVPEISEFSVAGSISLPSGDWVPSPEGREMRAASRLVVSGLYR